MKLLRICYDPQEAHRIRELLEGKGIPVYIRSEGARAANEWLVFVCLEPQFDDAQTILQFPSHSPAEPVDVGQFKKDIEAAGIDPVFNYLFKPLLASIATCVLPIFIIYQFAMHTG
jgi:hypothetical protein